MKLNNLDEQNKTKISLIYRGLNPRMLWQRLVELEIYKLQHLASIASARITLERQSRANPIFRVLAVLEVPGPDFHAEASDLTLHAALMKVAGILRRQMQSRKNRQLARRKNTNRLVFAGASNLSRI
jgi:ribosome-associated translation inhibitor RaiA